MSLTGTLGARAEKLALKHLIKQGLKKVAINYHCPCGEIDLILQDKDTLVFVEVRYRKNNDYGGALESIDWRKQQKVRRSAEHYLMTFNKANISCRFDILCVTGNLSKPDIYWVANAF